MPETTPATHFFTEFEHNIAEGNIRALVAQFAETYLNGGPQGYQLLRSADLAAGLPRRRELLNSLGCGPSHLVSLIETPLGDRFVLAQVRWLFPIDGAKDPVTVDSSYILEIAEPVRILVYISHHDLVAVLKARRPQSESLRVS
jgi:hypothetical protein